ncbi:MAG: glutathione peroxidase [Chthoniobacterales bacterium]
MTMEGKVTSLADFKGKAWLVVNVASRCGNTPQYTGLEKLAKTYQPQGLVVLGFPCNDFGNQEPGSTGEIREFCSVKYGVTFPILDKIHVKGPDQTPLYAALTNSSAKFPGEVKWNFGKFLISKDGEVLARFEPKMQPEDPALVSAIEGALK